MLDSRFTSAAYAPRQAPYAILCSIDPICISVSWGTACDSVLSFEFWLWAIGQLYFHFFLFLRQ